MGARSVSVCVKSFGLREVFGIVRSVLACEKCFGFVRIGSLSYWNVRISVSVLSFFFFEGTKNNPYLVKMPICK